MKKILATILAIIYLSTSMGMNIHLHYCMGKLISWGLVDHENKNCTNCGMPKTAAEKSGTAKNNCCTDEHKQIKPEKDQKIQVSDLQIAKPAIYETVGGQFEFMNYLSCRLSIYLHSQINDRLFVSKISLFVLNRNFRI